MMRHVASLLVLSLAVALARPAVATVLLTDDFNDPGGNNTASTFNNNLALTQGGSLATVTYNVQGTGSAAQHSNGGALQLENSNSNIGNVSLNNNFATNANSVNSPLTSSFNIVGVSGFTDSSDWVQFNWGNSQNLGAVSPGVGLGVYFRQSGVADVVTNGGNNIPDLSLLAQSVPWSAGDLVTITLSDSAGTGSAFNGNGSKATVSIGATNVGTFTLAQQTNAYATFSARNYENGLVGQGRFDNLSISVVAVPEPSVALFGVAAAVGLAIRRRVARAG